jgi:hypothetical protein
MEMVSPMEWINAPANPAPRRTTAAHCRIVMETTSPIPLTNAPWSGVRNRTAARLQWLRLGFDE